MVWWRCAVEEVFGGDGDLVAFTGGDGRAFLCCVVL